MKTKQLKEIKTKKVNDLTKLVQEKKLELLKTQAMIRSQQEKNLKKAKNLRVDIAQLRSIISEKQLSEEKVEDK